MTEDEIRERYSIPDDRCCGSCHDDMNHGWDPGHELTIDGVLVTGICCAVAIAVRVRQAGEPKQCPTPS